MKTGDGGELNFPSFRELQHAILTQRVVRGDTLIRPGTAPQLLASITELEPFFSGRAARPSEDLPQGYPASSSDSGIDQGSIASPIPPMRGKVDTLRPPLSAGAAPPPASPVDSRSGELGGAYAESGAQGVAVATPALGSVVGTEIAVATVKPMMRTRSGSYDDLYDIHRSPLPSLGDPQSVQGPRRVGGWVVAVALLLVVFVVGWTAAKPYFRPKSPAATVRPDARVRSLLALGERDMDDGDIEGAAENFDKVSVLAEQDPHVLLDQAKLAAVKADVPWLLLRLVPVKALEEVRVANAQLDALSGRARRAAEAARGSAPDDVAAIRVQIDALRLSGAPSAARSLVARVVAQSSQPETAYVLAALDLAESEPVWTTVLERLRLAAAGEGNEGRARAALVYALARSGNREAAQAELEKMDLLARPHPLLANLHAFVAGPPKRIAGEEETSDAAAGASSSGPLASTALATHRRSSGQGPSATDIGASDARVAMQLAAAALRRGDAFKARQIYEAIITKNPSNSEALSGLGDSARARSDTPAAVSAYRRAVAVNPSYLPALLGLADVAWSAGDHGSAVQAYADIVERFPEGTYPSYVAQRAASAHPSTGSGATAPVSPAESTPASSATPALGGADQGQANPMPATTYERSE